MAIDRWADAHFEYLGKLGFSTEDISEIQQDAKSETPVYEMSNLMANSWEGVIDPNIAPGWLENTLSMLKNNEVSRDKPRLNFYDESEWESLGSAVEVLCNAGVDESSLLTLIRACQKNILGNMFQLLDGGLGGDYHLFEIEYQDGELTPTRAFSNMEDFFINYDPKNIQRTGNE